MDGLPIFADSKTDLPEPSADSRILCEDSEPHLDYVKPSTDWVLTEEELDFVRDTQELILSPTVVSKTRKPSLKQDQQYFFTQTLKPEYHVMPIADQVAYTMPLVLRTLHAFSRFTLTIEFTKAGVVHYHAIGVMLDCHKYKKTFGRLREIGRVEMCIAKNPDKVFQYVVKDVKTTQEKLPDVFKECVLVDTRSYPFTASCKPVLNQLKMYLKEKQSLLEKEYTESIKSVPRGKTLQGQQFFQRTAGIPHIGDSVESSLRVKVQYEVKKKRCLYDAEDPTEGPDFSHLSKLPKAGP